MKSAFKVFLAMVAGAAAAATPDIPVVRQSEYDVYVTVIAGLIPNKDYYYNGTQFYLTDESGAEHPATADEVNARYRFMLVETGPVVDDEETGCFGCAFSGTSGYERIRYITETNAVEMTTPVGSATERRTHVRMHFKLPIEFFGDDQESYDFQSIWDGTCVSIVVEDTVSKRLYTLSETPGGCDERLGETPLFGSITLDPQEHAYGDGTQDNDVRNVIQTGSGRVYLGAELPFSTYFRLKSGLPTEADVRSWRTGNGVSQDAFDAALALGMTSTNEIAAFASTFKRFDVSVTSLAGNEATLSYSVLASGQPRALAGFPPGSTLTRCFATSPSGPWTELDSAAPAASASLVPPEESADSATGFFKFKLTIPPFFE